MEYTEGLGLPFGDILWDSDSRIQLSRKNCDISGFRNDQKVGSGLELTLQLQNKKPEC